MIKIIGFAFIAISLYGAKSITISKAQQNDLGIKLQEVTKMQNIALTPYNGIVSINKKDSISVSSNLDALVEDIYVSDFAHVKKGERLLTLKSNALLTLQKDYIESNIQNQSALLNYKRDVKLEAEGIISHKRLLASKNLYDSTQLTLKLQENQLLTNGFSQTMLEKLKTTNRPIISQTLYSPKSGVVNKVDVNVGEYVQAQKSMIGIYADSKRYIDISIPVKIAQNLAIGDMCEFSKYRAKIVALSTVVQKDSQALQVRAEIENPQGVMINRIYGVKILKNVSHSVKIRKTALVFVNREAFVFKKVESGFEVVSVKIISEGAVCYIVESELNAGDMLAVSSTAALLSAMEDENE